MTNETNQDRVIVALDTPDKSTCERLVYDLKDTIKVFKIGKELFTACGIEAVNIVQESGAQVFLDLKFHDIPNTVASTSRVVSRLGVKMFNVHASGGEKMMVEAKKAVDEESKNTPLQKPLILGVTILTSFDEGGMRAVYGNEKSIEEKVLEFATDAKNAGLDGVVASAKEVGMIKQKLGNDFVVVTPGVRPESGGVQDQKRVVTPKQAFELGSDYIVVGRPITQAENPKEAAQKILQELS